MTRISAKEARGLFGAPKRNKYGVRTDKAGKAARTVDGIVFDSLAEAKRYGELKRLERAGEIDGLILQPEFAIQVPTPKSRAKIIGSYIADFTYCHGGGMVVEDVKGMKTALYRFKKKCVEAQYGIKIVEIGRRHGANDRA